MKSKKKNLKEMIALGSKTAKAGFSNEQDIVNKFINWKNDPEAKEWLVLMGYDIKEIESVDAIILHGYKTDVQVQIIIYFKKAISKENLSIKLVSNLKSGGNQVDKRWVDTYIKMWTIPEDIAKLLKMFTGEIKPDSKLKLKDKRKVFFTEMDEISQNKIIDFFSKNKILIVTDILKGRDIMTAEWMMVVLKGNGKTVWTLKSINYAMNLFGGGEVKFTTKGNLKIGRIGMQRKGGDGGRPSANMLQFKINPVELFNN